MTDSIRKLFESDQIRVSIDNDGKMIFVSNGATCLEDYVEISKKGKIFTVSEIHRNDVKIVKETEEEDTAEIWAIIVAKKMFDELIDNGIIDTIETMVDDGKKSTIPDLLEKIGLSNYCVWKEERGKISLVPCGDRINIMYHGQLIAEQVREKRAYIILYNYCNKLKAVSVFCSKVDSIMNMHIHINYDELIDFYIF